MTNGDITFMSFYSRQTEKERLESGDYFFQKKVKEKKKESLLKIVKKKKCLLVPFQF